MKRYRVLKLVVLGFLTPRDQFDAFIAPEDGVTLECDGHTIWTNKDGKRRESITVASAIEYWLDQGLIVEIPE